MTPPSGARLPWEDWRRRGIPAAFADTLRLLATDPIEAFGRLRRDGDLTSPLLFALGAGLLGLVAQIVWTVLFQGALLSLPGADPGVIAALLGGGVFSLVFALLLAPILLLVSVFILSALVHGGLLLVGALEGSPLGFEGTVKVVCYSSISGLAALIPFFGGWASILVSILLQVLGLRRVHETTTGRALLAVLVPWMVCCLVGILGFAGLAALVAGLAAAA